MAKTPKRSVNPMTARQYVVLCKIAQHGFATAGPDVYPGYKVRLVYRIGGKMADGATLIRLVQKRYLMVVGMSLYLTQRAVDELAALKTYQ